MLESVTNCVCVLLKNRGDEERCADAFLSCVFQSGALFDRVFKTYKLMHTNQTVNFVKQKVN